MSKPDITLSFTRDWCSRHLGPFRAEWPKGAALGMLKLFEALLADEGFIALAPKDADGISSTKSIEPIISEIAPICCWLGDEKMAAVYEAAGVGPLE